MSDITTIFYRKNKAVSVDFSAEEISSDGAVVLLEKVEREHKLLRYFSSYIPEHRHPLLITHSIEKLYQMNFKMRLKKLKYFVLDLGKKSKHSRSYGFIF